MRIPRRRRGPAVDLVVLKPDREDLRAQVVELAPKVDQERYSGRARETLSWADSRPGMTPFAVVAKQQPVGFGILDTTQLDLVSLTAHPERAILLRSFYVDARHQRQGYGRSAAEAVPTLAQLVWPRADVLFLTVNSENTVALRTYLSAGYIDTGELFEGGSIGPQHVLTHPLNPRL